VEGALALSNDARRLVYKSSAAAPLYLRKMDTGEVTPIAGTENGDLPFFSPDGEWIGFYSEADRAIKKVALSGGSPITIDKVPQPIRGAIWSRENSILFASPGKRFSQVSASGGAAQPLGTYDSNKTERWPTLLPDGRHLLYTINDNSTNYERAKIAVLSLRDRTSRIVLEGGTLPRYCCGHLIYSHSGGLFADAEFPFPARQDDHRGGRGRASDGGADGAASGARTRNDGARDASGHRRERVCALALRLGNRDARPVRSAAARSAARARYSPGSTVGSCREPSPRASGEKALVRSRAIIRPPTDAQLWYFPPTVLNPIELWLAKLKTLLRTARRRTVEELCTTVATCLSLFSSTECRNYFRHCGYAAATQS
jgi:WD40-like Beta Propeller Repeat